MRYWILDTGCWMLDALLNGLFALVIHFAAPEIFWSNAYYAGTAICALIAMVITWRDPPDRLDNVLFFLFKWGIVASGLAFFFWGIGYKLEFWGEHKSDVPFSSAADIAMPNLAMFTGGIIIWWIIQRYLWRKE